MAREGAHLLRVLGDEEGQREVVEAEGDVEKLVSVGEEDHVGHGIVHNCLIIVRSFCADDSVTR